MERLAKNLLQNLPAGRRAAGQKWYDYLKRELAPLEDYLKSAVSSDDALIEASCLALLEAGGKRIRPGFAYLAGRLFGADLTDMLPLLAALELIHTGSLVHDDIIDDAKMRRGKPTVSFIHGGAAALYVGDFLIGRALELVSVCKNQRINRSLNRTVLQMCRGELVQARDLFRVEQSLRAYFVRIRCKTALLFAGSCECGALQAGAAEEQIDAMWRFGYRLGMAFQIIDDLLDLLADEKTLGKPAGNDLKQGNLTLPVLFALQDDDGKLAEAIGSIKNGAAGAAEYALGLVRASGGAAKAQATARRFLDAAAAELRFLPQSAELSLLSAVITDFGSRLNSLCAD